MKGELTIEYLISFLVFIGLIAYIYLSYSANIPSFMEEVRKEDTRSKAFQLSEVLINDPGEPINWNELAVGSIDRIGLLDHTLNRSNLISQVKINKLNLDFTCPANYDRLQSRLAMDKQFSIIISEIDPSTGDRNPLYSCFPPSPVIGTINTTLIRVVVVNDSSALTPAEVIIQM